MQQQLNNGKYVKNSDNLFSETFRTIYQSLDSNMDINTIDKMFFSDDKPATITEILGSDAKAKFTPQPTNKNMINPPKMDNFGIKSPSFIPQVPQIQVQKKANIPHTEKEAFGTKSLLTSRMNKNIFPFRETSSFIKRSKTQYTTLKEKVPEKKDIPATSKIKQEINIHVSSRATSPIVIPEKKSEEMIITDPPTEPELNDHQLLEVLVDPVEIKSEPIPSKEILVEYNVEDLTLPKEILDSMQNKPQISKEEFIRDEIIPIESPDEPNIYAYDDLANDICVADIINERESDFMEFQESEGIIKKIDDININKDMVDSDSTKTMATNKSTKEKENDNKPQTNKDTQVAERPNTYLTSIRTTPIPQSQPVQVIQSSNESQNVKIFPTLTVNDIITSFKVIGGLELGSKVRIEKDRFFAKDDTYLQSFFRKTTQKDIIDFLNHIYSETQRIVNGIITNIIEKTKLGETRTPQFDLYISDFQNIFISMSVFLHNFETMAAPYRDQTVTFAQLDNIHQNFTNYLTITFRSIFIKQ